MAKVTQKYQIAIPKEMRHVLDVKPGEEVEWTVVKAMAVVSPRKKIKNPTKVLMSQLKKPLNIDAVKLIRKVREEFK